MFKFIKKYAETIDNVEVYPIFSLFIFLLFFIVLIFMVMKMDKKRVELLSHIPFEKKEEETTMKANIV